MTGLTQSEDRYKEALEVEGEAGEDDQPSSIPRP